jgi:hypothetical protein
MESLERVGDAECSDSAHASSDSAHDINHRDVTIFTSVC